MADMDKVKEKVKDVVEMVGEKAKEIKDSEQTKKVIEKTKATAVKVGEKTKDVAIDVGVKLSDVAENLASRGQKLMHEVKQKNDAKKESCCDTEIISEEDCEVVGAEE